MSVKDTDAFGNRMKEYEMAEAGRCLIPLLPVIARIDGRGFSRFTKGLERPYDARLTQLMVDTVKYLIEESDAVIGYTQSDEITLAWLQTSYTSERWFGGRVQKLTSVLAGLATAYFNRNLLRVIPEKESAKYPVFDCRVWNVPNVVEGANCFLWREQDAFKNAISMAAHHYFSNKRLHKKNGSEMQEMLFQEHSINFNDYPASFKRGTYVRRRSVLRNFTPDELSKLPEKHNARVNPDFKIERHVIETLDLPPIGTISNRAGFIFNGEDPITMKMQEGPEISKNRPYDASKIIKVLGPEL